MAADKKIVDIEDNEELEEEEEDDDLPADNGDDDDADLIKILSEDDHDEEQKQDRDNHVWVATRQDTLPTGDVSMKEDLHSHEDTGNVDVGNVVHKSVEGESAGGYEDKVAE